MNLEICHCIHMQEYPLSKFLEVKGECIYDFDRCKIPVHHCQYFDLLPTRSESAQSLTASHVVKLWDFCRSGNRDTLSQCSFNLKFSWMSIFLIFHIPFSVNYFFLCPLFHRVSSNVYILLWYLHHIDIFLFYIFRLTSLSVFFLMATEFFSLNTFELKRPSHSRL